MTAVLQMTIWNAFSWMKCFTEICSQGSNWQFSSIGYKRDAIMWTIADPVHRRIYTTLGGDELRCLMWKYTLASTHWGRVTHICVGNLTIIGSDNGLSPGRRQTIIWTNDGIVLIGPLRTNFNENLMEILIFSFRKMRLKVSSAKWRPFCNGLNVFKYIFHQIQLYSFKQNGLIFCLHRSQKTVNLQTHKLNTYWFMDRLITYTGV